MNTDQIKAKIKKLEKQLKAVEDRENRILGNLVRDWYCGGGDVEQLRAKVAEVIGGADAPAAAKDKERAE